MKRLKRIVQSSYRLLRFAYLKTLRLKGTSHSIAAGFAAGAAVSMMPLVGLHFMLGFVLAFVTRGNMLASAIGTAVGNPWTFPFIWAGTYKLGMLILRQPAEATPDFAQVMETVAASVASLSPATVIDVALPIWGPMLLGSLPVAFFAWLAFYYLIKAPLERRRDMIAAKRKALLAAAVGETA